MEYEYFTKEKQEQLLKVKIEGFERSLFNAEVSKQIYEKLKTDLGVDADAKIRLMDAEIKKMQTSIESANEQLAALNGGAE